MQRYAPLSWPAAAFLSILLCPASWADELAGAVRFRQQVRPILETYCYGCHGYGSSEGGRTLDEFASDDAMLGDIDLWRSVLKNVRSKMMPPASEESPSDAERKQIQDWIEADVFGTDPTDPDPGHVTLRRLNRVEYHNTIRDLMGVDFDTHENFPPDDTGYGFDNIGDVLTMSPLLMEKYMSAAETIVTKAVPTVSKVVAVNIVDGDTIRSEDGKTSGREMSFYDAANIAGKIPIKKAAKYRVVVEARIDGYYQLDPGRCEVTCELDGQQMFKNEYDWRDHRDLRYDVEKEWQPGEYPIRFELKPLEPADKKIKFLNFCVDRIRIEGPLDEVSWIEPENYRRFFPQGPPPEPPAEREQYARQLLGDFALRAYRRPADAETVERLVALAKAVYEQPGRSFEEGISQAMIAILASPRFLFRVEEPAPTPDGQKYPLIDEFALASRLSYFLWSTMPDDELLDLAAENKLRANLKAQVARMLADPDSDGLIADFTGQWLQARDVETISIDAVAALGHQKEFEELLTKARALRDRSRQARERNEAEQKRQQAAESNESEKKDSEKDVDKKEESDETDKEADAKVQAEKDRSEKEKQELEAERTKIFAEFHKFGELRDKFSEELRHAMREETEMCFAYVAHEDRSVLELIDSNYTFLNAKLAEHYGIPGVEGDEMRRVELPADSPRGGILTQGTMLIVTSNPTRTSPVKRGLFILDNILGTPAPPPPGAVPPLEASAEAITDHPPTLREALDRHRSEPLCAACHARMDPLGLALENFNAIGMWRDTEHDQPFDTSGTMLTGESFKDFRELKKELKDSHRLDFYRCLAEKMLTYALGRGLEYYDEYTVDQLVQKLDEDDGRFGVLLDGIVESAPFQRQRRVSEPGVDQQARHESVSNK